MERKRLRLAGRVSFTSLITRRSVFGIYKSAQSFLMGTVLATPVYHVERIDGCERQKPLPKQLHAFAQMFLMRQLLADLPSSFLPLPELNVLCGEDRLVPDITVVRQGARYDDGDLAEPAALAVEILSPGQTLSDLLDKAERLLRAGTPLAWVIWPERRKAWEYSLDDLKEASMTLGISLSSDRKLEISLAELWNLLAKQVF